MMYILKVKSLNLEELADLLEVIYAAAKDAHVRLTQVEWRTQGKDHPILLAAPETQYLKCGIFRVEKD